MNNNFNKIYESSIKNPEDFWQEIADDIFWFKKPTKILNRSKPPFLSTDLTAEFETFNII